MIFKSYVKYIYLSLGIIILSFALPLNVHALLGSDPLSCVNKSVSLLLNVKFGTALYIVNFIFVIAHYLYFKNIRFTLVAFVCCIINGFIVNLFNDYLIVNLDNTILYQQICLLLISYCLLCISIALIQKSMFQKLPFEAFQEIFASIFQKDINFIRVIVEVCCVIIGIIIFLIGNNNFLDYVNIGTLFIMVGTGPGVYFVYKKILKGE